MKRIAVGLLLLGIAGAILFPEAQLRWESAGGAVVGLVLLLSGRIDGKKVSGK